jgi:hypothetical protein
VCFESPLEVGVNDPEVVWEVIPLKTVNREAYLSLRDPHRARSGLIRPISARYSSGLSLRVSARILVSRLAS